MSVRRVSRYWHTLRHLKSRQILGRVWFRLYRPRPELFSTAASKNPELKWIACARAQSMFGPDTFSFLNRKEQLQWPHGWTAGERGELWCYNLHYFDDLVAIENSSRSDWHAKLIGRWIDDNPPGNGIGWAPYPTSLRIVNWIKWDLAHGNLDNGAKESLATQVHWLSKRLEFHLLGNHLWANAKALVFAGCYLDFELADALLKKGLEILDSEMNSQVLSDGGHYERSPMYHALFLEDVLDLLQLAMIYPGYIPVRVTENLELMAVKMIHWLDVMSHPDSEVSHFNDSVKGIARTSIQLRKYAQDFGFNRQVEVMPSFVELKESGYIRANTDNAVLICNVGSLGPDFQPGHAHADSLSFELSLYGKRIFVNSGIDRYEESAERTFQRSTAAHNTVEVGGVNSSDTWKSFRVGRRAKVRLLQSDASSSGEVQVCAEHDGYRQLSYGVVHKRSWKLASNELHITDELVGEAVPAVSRVYLHPQVKINSCKDSACQVEIAGKLVELAAIGSQITISQGTYHPEFGRSVPSQHLVQKFQNTKSVLTVRWQ